MLIKMQQLEHEPKSLVFDPSWFTIPSDSRQNHVRWIPQSLIKAYQQRGIKPPLLVTINDYDFCTSLVLPSFCRLNSLCRDDFSFISRVPVDPNPSLYGFRQNLIWNSLIEYKPSSSSFSDTHQPTKHALTKPCGALRYLGTNICFVKVLSN